MSRINHLKHRVTFQTPPKNADGTPAVSANGFPLDDQYTDYATVWAEVVGGSTTRIYGKDFLADQALQSQDILMVTCRYRKDITPDMRMIYNGRPYAIEVVSDKDGMQVWMDLMVKGWQNGGV